MSELTEFRLAKDQFFATDNQSPLAPEQKRDFKGLNYFPENSAMHLELLLEEFPQKDEIEIQTTSGDIQKYTRYGKIRFEVDGQPVELTIYHNEYGYFLPFVDSQANHETYGAGRYLEPAPVEDGKLVVDFNLAYNPYCAYNDTWSCPITPWENHLKVPIKAGEKIYHE